MSTKITEVPTVDGTVVVGDNWSDVKLTGGKAVGMNGEEVSGIFAISITTPINNASNYLPEITFTPDDERYASSTATISITVNPAPIKFLDENGAETVPEMTVPYGTKFGDIKYKLEPYAYGPDVIAISVKDCDDTAACSTGTYTAVLIPHSGVTVLSVTPLALYYTSPSLDCQTF